jgi:ribosomal protein L37E
VSRARQLLTGLLGIAFVGCALLVLGYAVVEGELPSDLGWLVLVVLPFVGALMLRRAQAWNEPLHCRRCGALLTRDDEVCSRCGLDLSKTAWATIGKFKLS